MYTKGGDTTCNLQAQGWVLAPLSEIDLIMLSETEIMCT